MNGYIIAQFLETCTLVVLGIALLIIITSSFYDVWMTRQRKNIDLQTKKLQRNRPHITVLVYAKNNADTILTCLTSILKNRYRQYDIVVVNNRSTDQTRQRLRHFCSDHPTARLVVYNKRKETLPRIALQQAYKKSQRGDIILTLRADSELSKTFLKESVASFMAMSARHNKRALLFNEHTPSSHGLLGVLRHFFQTNRHTAWKVRSLFHILGISNNRRVPTAMYEKSLFTQQINTRMIYIFCSRVSLMIIPGIQLPWPKRTVGEVMRFYAYGLLAISYGTYSMYMAATLQNTALLLLGWLLVVIWFFAGIWSDDTSQVSDKFRLSFVLPSLYFFLYLMIIIEIIVRSFTRIAKGLRTVVRGIVVFYASQPLPLEE